MSTTYLSRRCLACGMVGGRHFDSCPDWATTIIVHPLPPGDGLSFTGVINAVAEGPQSHAEGRIRPGGTPVWAVASVVVGLALMAVGFVARDPVAQAIWGWLR